MSLDPSESRVPPAEAASSDSIGEPDLSHPARAAGLVAALCGVRENLLCGMRLALLRRTPMHRLSVSGGQLILLSAIDVLFAFGLDFVAVGVHGRFNMWGLPGTLFYLPLMLLGGYLIARSAHEPKLALTLPIALLSAGPYVSLITLALYPLESVLDLSHRAIYFAYYWGPMFWWIAIIAFITRTLTPGRTSVKLCALALMAMLVVAPSLLLPRASMGALWIPVEEESAQPRESPGSLASEEAFYAQPELLRRALSGIAPGTRESAHLYFVGVAGYAEEDVFRKELHVISSLMRDRFGTAGRNINLINNPATALSTPLASRTSLARTLKRIGQVMNRDNDVLFLYLTSHGSEDQHFALSFRPLHLRDLDPPSLRQMLDAAQIRWRIVVVSACYSGGFIDALKNDTTLVMTAADAHHTSFGCGSESDFTYFGKAYFDQALRNGTSFTGAFEDARGIIEARERGEGKTPSHPQMYVGAAMREKLRTFETELRTRKD